MSKAPEIVIEFDDVGTDEVGDSSSPHATSILRAVKKRILLIISSNIDIWMNFTSDFLQFILRGGIDLMQCGLNRLNFYCQSFFYK